MARPLKEGLDYFTHDCDMREDPRLKMMRATFGNDGYAFYCVLLEIIYAQPKCRLILSPEMEDYAIKEVRVSRRKFREMLEFSMEKAGLFDVISWKNEKSLISDAIKERARLALQHREAMRMKRGLVCASQTPQQTLAQTPTQTPQRTLPYPNVPYRNNVISEVEDGKIRPTPPSPPPSPNGELVGATLAAFQAIEENLSLSAADAVEAQNACLRYRPEWIRGAVKEACDHNKLTWKYTAAILRRWEGEGKR